MLEFIKNNITWIKEIFTIIFASTATILAILTYRRARHTVLQPIRSETIKKQSELFSKLLIFLKEDFKSFESEIDYVNLVRYNVFLALKDYGFIFKEQIELFENIEKNISGWMPCGYSKNLTEVELVQTFYVENEGNNETNYEKLRYEKLKNGESEINKIYLTEKLNSFFSGLSKFLNDPFLPSPIQTVLKEFSLSININITKFLKEELELFTLKFSKDYFEKGTAPKFDPLGVYNSFNHKRIHHKQSMMKLKKEIREYLLVDKPW